MTKVTLIGEPSKAEVAVQRVKIPPNFKILPHAHSYSEVITVLSGHYGNAMGHEKGEVVAPGSVSEIRAKKRTSGDASKTAVARFGPLWISRQEAEFSVLRSSVGGGPDHRRVPVILTRQS